MYGCRANSGSSIYGDKCIFHCTRGYKAAGGSSERSCNESGQWTGDELKCQGMRPSYHHFQPLVNSFETLNF